MDVAVAITELKTRAASRPIQAMLALCLILGGALVPARASIAPSPWPAPYGTPVVDSVTVTPTWDMTWLADHLAGRSGRMRARMVLPSDALFDHLSALVPMDAAARQPGIRALPGGNSLITLVPFDWKRGTKIEGYRVGNWPYERRVPRSAAYANPTGFILVTEENQYTWLSEHFCLRDFLTHDQTAVWPKALVLREELIDKLELVIADLTAHGYTVGRMRVLSGFRHPRYNALLAGALGAVSDSRHQYGDAADVIIDNDGDGSMDDLNGDGRVDVRDARVILAAVERVETLHPELTGGVGLYRGQACGPFAHVDARGHRARWGA